MPQFTINVPDTIAKDVAEAFGVIQGQDDPAETPAQAWTRAKKKMIAYLHNQYKYWIEQQAANNVTITETISEET